jgi:hypothetical protein
MTEGDSELRRIVAREQGLDEEAAGFLHGESLSELEESAAALGKLLGERRDEPEPEPAHDFLAAMAAAQTAKKRTFLAAVVGRPTQRRDEHGRFAASTGFDGGARQPAPVRRSPEEEHNEMIVRMASLSRAFRGSF